MFESGVGAALNRHAAKPCHVDSFPALHSFHDGEFHYHAFTSAPLRLLGAVPSDRCMVNEDVPPGAVAIYETVPVLDVKPVNGSENSFFVFVVVEVVLPLLHSSHNLLPLSRGLVSRHPHVRGDLDKPAPQDFHLLSYGFLPHSSFPLSTASVSRLQVS